MALGIPILASPVGVNTSIIEDGESGILCPKAKNWREGFRLLANDPEMRKSMGEKGKVQVETHYSVEANRENFLALFKR